MRIFLTMFEDTKQGWIQDFFKGGGGGGGRNKMQYIMRITGEVKTHKMGGGQK